MLPDEGANPGLVDAILALHGVGDRWTELPAKGVANRIFATREVVLRIATDHPEAVADARTESVAAPAAWAAGIKTPRLLAFDDSRTLINRPYSLWERVHGETVGHLAPPSRLLLSLWAEVGRELAHLHARVQDCPDPNGWLDAQVAEDPRVFLGQWALLEPASGLTARVERCLMTLDFQTPETISPRFLHGDLYDMNLMCDGTGRLSALIDWGDAGWGDPALDFADVPLPVLGVAVGAYQAASGSLLGTQPFPRILHYRFGRALRRASLGRHGAIDALAELVQFSEAAVANAAGG